MALPNQETVDYPSFKLVITDLQGSAADIIKIAMLKIHSVITEVETPASRVDAKFFYSEIDDSEDELVDEVEGPLVEKASVAEDVYLSLHNEFQLAMDLHTSGGYLEHGGAQPSQKSKASMCPCTARGSSLGVDSWVEVAAWV